MCGNPFCDHASQYGASFTPEYPSYRQAHQVLAGNTGLHHRPEDMASLPMPPRLPHHPQRHPQDPVVLQGNGRSLYLHGGAAPAPGHNPPKVHPWVAGADMVPENTKSPRLATKLREEMES